MPAHLNNEKRLKVHELIDEYNNFSEGDELRFTYMQKSERVRNMKPKTEKLLKYTPKDGTTYGYDEYAVILTLGKPTSKELES
ncbi:MAG: hypothetical protein WCF03_00055 [Nitrososphaeraceae archaeon]